ncbi:MAG: carboxymuconolactone decarboxylase family protein [Planctomycetes bacterium]|nr:carboxymuconolactone decarboxylase family protein [Planctomycetota bacterium]
MDKYFEDKISSSIRNRKSLHALFLEKSSTYKPFLDVEKTAFKDGALQKKQKELMALSISIVTKCEPCIEWHVQQAHLAGATEEEINEANDVAIEMGGGPAVAYARFALNALQYHQNNQP